MSNTNWLIFDPYDFEVVSNPLSSEEEAKAEHERLSALIDAPLVYDTTFNYDYAFRRHELKAMMAATICAGVIAPNEDTDLSMDWAIGRAETLLEKIR